MTKEEQIAAVRQRISELDVSIKDVIEHGDSYSVQGSHSVTKVKLTELRNERYRLHLELRALIRGTSMYRQWGVPRYE